MSDMADFGHEADDDNWDYVPCAKTNYTRREQSYGDVCGHKFPAAPKCCNCGEICRWSVNGAGVWRLFGADLGSPMHHCGQATADDFEMLV